MSVEVDDRAGADAPVAALEGGVEAVLAAEGATGAEVGVVLVGAEAMRTLNRDHRGRDEPTDVLSFPIDEEGVGLEGVPRLLGDVVLCVPVLLDQAAERGVEPGEELADLLVHGVLHLLGYDHETDDGAMLRRQDELVAGLAPPAWRPARGG